MTIGSSQQDQIGRIGNKIIQRWRGRYIERTYTKHPFYLTSKRYVIQDAMRRVVDHWHDLGINEVESWNNFARLNYASKVNSEVVGKVCFIVRRPRCRFRSGLEAYISSNMLSALSGLPYPRRFPPIFSACEPPRDVMLSFKIDENGVFWAVVDWTDPPVINDHRRDAIRLWARMFGRRRIHPQIIGVYNRGDRHAEFSKMWGHCQEG